MLKQKRARGAATQCLMHTCGTSYCASVDESNETGRRTDREHWVKSKITQHSPLAHKRKNKKWREAVSTRWRQLCSLPHEPVAVQFLLAPSPTLTSSSSSTSLHPPHTHARTRSLTHPSSRPVHRRHVFSFLLSPLFPLSNSQQKPCPFAVSLSLSLSLSLTFPLSLPPPAGPWLKKPCSPPPPPLAGLHGAALHGKRGNEEETDEAATLVWDSLILLRSVYSFPSLSCWLFLIDSLRPSVRPRTTVLDLSWPSFSCPLLCTHTRA